MPPADATKTAPMALAKERSGENGLNGNNDTLVQSIMEGIDQVASPATHNSVIEHCTIKTCIMPVICDTVRGLIHTDMDSS